ncbi:hypothetical protein PV646_25955 [Streptomyces sp. ID05-26A]|nr:hypothetical protein [Streptomyces sp. ID05-26A]
MRRLRSPLRVDAVHTHRHDHETLPRQLLGGVLLPAVARDRVPGRTQHQRALADERARREHDRGGFEGRDRTSWPRSPSECPTFPAAGSRPSAELAGAASTIAITTAAAALPITMSSSHLQLVSVL